uniref:Integrase_H2C2 domain-containing protein n=1 Tax=Macrostomum lignano TaxID=282301 RepID=A0A1I8J244_9PLAT
LRSSRGPSGQLTVSQQRLHNLGVATAAEQLLTTAAAATIPEPAAADWENLRAGQDHQMMKQKYSRQARPKGARTYHTCGSCCTNTAMKKTLMATTAAESSAASRLMTGRESEDGDEGERQLLGHEYVQQIVEAGEPVDVGEGGQQDGGGDGQGASEQHPLPALPAQPQEALHDELARVGAGHGGGLASSQDAHRPDVHAGQAELAAEEDAAPEYFLEKTSSSSFIQCVIVHVGMRIVVGHTGVVDGTHGLLAVTLGEHGHHEQVDEKGHEQSDGGLHEEVLVGLTHRPPVLPVHVTRLHEGAVQVDVVRHDHRSDGAHRLQQLTAPAAAAPRHHQAAQHLPLVGLHHHVLVAERDGHEQEAGHSWVKLGRSLRQVAAADHAKPGGQPLHEEPQDVRQQQQPQQVEPGQGASLKVSDAHEKARSRVCPQLAQGEHLLAGLGHRDFLIQLGELPLDKPDRAQVWLTAFQALARAKGWSDSTERKTIADNFLAICGLTALEKLQSPVSPRPLTELSFEDIQTTFVTYLRPKEKLIIAERARFFKTQQLQGESISDFVSRLRQAATDCKFDDLKACRSPSEELISTALIAGLRDSREQQRVLEAMQLKLMSVSEITDFIRNLEQVDGFVARQMDKATGQSKSPCTYEATLNYAQSVSMETVRINDKPFKMQIDTGASVSVLSSAQWALLGKPPLMRSNRRLEAFDGHVMKSLGKVTATVELRGRLQPVELIVVSSEKTYGLLGRDLLESDGVFHASDVQAEKIAVEPLPCIRGVKARMELVDDKPTLEKRLAAVRTRLSEKRVTINEAKSISYCDSVSFLGFRISAAGIQPDDRLYARGSSIPHVDALSRLRFDDSSSDDKATFETINSIAFESPVIDAKRITAEMELDALTQRILNRVRQGDWRNCSQAEAQFKKVSNKLTLENGLLYMQRRVFIPPRLRKAAFDAIHDTHTGMHAAHSLMSTSCWWPGMQQDVAQFVRRCPDCCRLRPQLGHDRDRWPPSTRMEPQKGPFRPSSRFDFAGHSHNHWHLCVVLGMLWMRHCWSDLLLFCRGPSGQLTVSQQRLHNLGVATAAEQLLTTAAAATIPEPAAADWENLRAGQDHQMMKQKYSRQARPKGARTYHTCGSCCTNTAMKKTLMATTAAESSAASRLMTGRESEDGDEGERQLLGHEYVQQIVEAGEPVDVGEGGQQDGGGDGQGASEQHPLPALPAQPQEALHDELARVGAGHGGGLASSQDAHRPDVHAGQAELAAEEDAAPEYFLEKTSSSSFIQCVIVHVGMRIVVGHTGVVDGTHGLLAVTLGEHGHHEQVDEKGHEQSDGGLHEEVLVGLTHRPPVLPVHVTRLHEGAVQVDVVRHDHRSDGAHRLQQLTAPAAAAPRHHQAAQHLPLVGLHHHVLVAERDGHEQEAGHSWVKLGRSLRQVAAADHAKPGGQPLHEEPQDVRQQQQPQQVEPGQGASLKVSDAHEKARSRVCPQLAQGEHLLAGLGHRDFLIQLGELPLDKPDRAQVWLTAFQALARAKGWSDSTERKTIADNFLAICGLTALEKLQSPVSPRPLTELSFEDIQTTFVTYLRPKEKLIIAERARFFKTQQLQGESISDFVSRLRQAATDCKFDDLKACRSPSEELISTALIAGLRDSREQQRVLEAMQLKLMSVSEITDFIRNLEQVDGFVARQMDKATGQSKSPCTYEATLQLRSIRSTREHQSPCSPVRNGLCWVSHHSMRSNRRLEAFDGHVMKSLGKVTATVELRGRLQPVELIVVSSEKTYGLLGRDLLESDGVFHASDVQAEKIAVEPLPCIRGVKARMELVDDKPTLEKRLAAVRTRLSEKRVTINEAKSISYCDSVSFLGFRISAAGIQPDDRLYARGSSIPHVDALSRLRFDDSSSDDKATFETINSIAFESPVIDAKRITAEMELDALTQRILNRVRQGDWRNCSQAEAQFKKVSNKLTLENGLLYMQRRVFIPPRLRKAAFDAIHDTHTGMHAAHSLMSTSCWWPGMQQDVAQFANGAAERAVQTVKSALRAWSEKITHMEFSRFLQKVLLHHRNSTSSRGCCPAEILFGRRLRVPVVTNFEQVDSVIYAPSRSSVGNPAKFVMTAGQNTAWILADDGLRLASTNQLAPMATRPSEFEMEDEDETNSVPETGNEPVAGIQTPVPEEAVQLRRSLRNRSAPERFSHEVEATAAPNALTYVGSSTFSIALHCARIFAVNSSELMANGNRQNFTGLNFSLEIADPSRLVITWDHGCEDSLQIIGPEDPRRQKQEEQKQQQLGPVVLAQLSRDSSGQLRLRLSCSCDGTAAVPLANSAPVPAAGSCHLSEEVPGSDDSDNDDALRINDVPPLGEDVQRKSDASNEAVAEASSSSYASALEEFVTTERTYVRRLGLVFDVYYLGLQSAVQERRLTCCSQDELKRVFGHFQSMRLLHEQLLSDLLESEQQLGQLMCQYGHQLKSYSTYYSTFPQTTATVRGWMTDEAFRREFAQLRQQCTDQVEAQLDLRALLLEPVQRPMRYPMLLDRYLEEIGSGHVDFASAHRAKNTVLESLSELEKSLRDFSAFQERLQLLRSVAFPATLAPHWEEFAHCCLRHGRAWQEEKPRYLLLSRRTLLICAPSRFRQETWTAKRALPVPGDLRVLGCEGCLLRMDTDSDARLQLEFGSRRGAEEEAAGTAATAVATVSASAATGPWSCADLGCGATYRLLQRRRLSCRVCGGAFCSDCTSYQAQTSWGGDKSLRCCFFCRIAAGAEPTELASDRHRQLLARFRSVRALDENQESLKGHVTAWFSGRWVSLWCRVDPEGRQLALYKHRRDFLPVMAIQQPQLRVEVTEPENADKTGTPTELLVHDHQRRRDCRLRPATGDDGSLFARIAGLLGRCADDLNGVGTDSVDADPAPPNSTALQTLALPPTTASPLASLSPSPIPFGDDLELMPEPWRMAAAAMQQGRYMSRVMPVMPMVMAVQCGSELSRVRNEQVTNATLSARMRQWRLQLVMIKQGFRNRRVPQQPRVTLSKAAAKEPTAMPMPMPAEKKWPRLPGRAGISVAMETGEAGVKKFPGRLTHRSDFLKQRLKSGKAWRAGRKSNEMREEKHSGAAAQEGAELGSEVAGPLPLTKTSKLFPGSGGTRRDPSFRASGLAGVGGLGSVGRRGRQPRGWANKTGGFLEAACSAAFPFFPDPQSTSLCASQQASQQSVAMATATMPLMATPAALVASFRLSFRTFSSRLSVFSVTFACTFVAGAMNGIDFSFRSSCSSNRGDDLPSMITEVRAAGAAVPESAPTAMVTQQCLLPFEAGGLVPVFGFGFGAVAGGGCCSLSALRRTDLARSSLLMAIGVLPAGSRRTRAGGVEGEEAALLSSSGLASSFCCTCGGGAPKPMSGTAPTGSGGCFGSSASRCSNTGSASRSTSISSSGSGSLSSFSFASSDCRWRSRFEVGSRRFWFPTGRRGSACSDRCLSASEPSALPSSTLISMSSVILADPFLPKTEIGRVLRRPSLWSDCGSGVFGDCESAASLSDVFWDSLRRLTRVCSAICKLCPMASCMQSLMSSALLSCRALQAAAAKGFSRQLAGHAGHGRPLEKGEHGGRGELALLRREAVTQRRGQAWVRLEGVRALRLQELQHRLLSAAQVSRGGVQQRLRQLLADAVANGLGRPRISYPRQAGQQVAGGQRVPHGCPTALLALGHFRVRIGLVDGLETVVEPAGQVVEAEGVAAQLGLQAVVSAGDLVGGRVVLQQSLLQAGQRGVHGARGTGVGQNAGDVHGRHRHAAQAGVELQRLRDVPQARESDVVVVQPHLRQAGIQVKALGQELRAQVLHPVATDVQLAEILVGAEAAEQVGDGLRRQSAGVEAEKPEAQAAGEELAPVLAEGRCVLGPGAAAWVPEGVAAQVKVGHALGQSAQEGWGELWKGQRVWLEQPSGLKLTKFAKQLILGAHRVQVEVAAHAAEMLQVAERRRAREALLTAAEGFADAVQRLGGEAAAAQDQPLQTAAEPRQQGAQPVLPDRSSTLMRNPLLASNAEAIARTESLWRSWEIGSLREPRRPCSDRRTRRRCRSGRTCPSPAGPAPPCGLYQGLQVPRLWQPQIQELLLCGAQLRQVKLQAGHQMRNQLDEVGLESADELQDLAGAYLQTGAVLPPASSRRMSRKCTERSVADLAFQHRHLHAIRTA